MDSALNQSGVLTRAAKARSGESYRCPICRVQVIYVSGPIQSPHFRHYPRTTIEEQRTHECPNYVADQGETGSHIYHGRIAKSPPPPQPRLAVGWVRSARETQSWGLFAAIPVPPADVRSVRIDEYINGAVDIPRDLVMKRRQFFVRANPRQYQAIGYDRNGRAVWYPKPTDPLLLSLNVFRAGVSGGLQLAPDEPLVKGQSYFVLCRSKFWSPPPKDLFRELPRIDLCDPRREWIGVLVYVPRAKRSDLTTWCSRVAERELVDSPPGLDLVLPPARAMDPDGACRIASGQHVVLALRGGEWIEPIVEIIDEESGQTSEAELEIEAGEFLRLGPFKAGAYTIHVRDWQIVSLRLAVVEAMPANIFGVDLRTSSQDGVTELQASVFQSEASERWSAVFSGREVWRGISLPDHWPVSVSWYSKKSGERSQQRLTSAEEVAGAVSNCLNENPDYSALAAGVFGTITFQKPAVVAKTNGKANRLPADLCARMQWLALACRYSPTDLTVPLDISVPSEWAGCLNEADRRLVASFLDVARWPIGFLPQARSVGKELANELRRKSPHGSQPATDCARLLSGDLPAGS